MAERHSYQLPEGSVGGQAEATRSKAHEFFVLWLPPTPEEGASHNAETMAARALVSSSG
jgi:hypothetical protein